MKCASALSTARDPRAAVEEVLSGLTAGLAGDRADLTLAFASPHHAEALGGLSAASRARGLTRHVLGCTAETIVADGREIEGDPALVLWAIRLPAGSRLTPISLLFDGQRFNGWPEVVGPGGRALVLLGDPFSFPADHWLMAVREGNPGLPVVGGMASGAQAPGRNRLVLDDEVFEDGAVAALLHGPFSIRTVVSQGCRPIGRPMIVTKAEKNLIRELGRRPALEVFRETFAELEPDDQELVRQGLHLGRVINEYQGSFDRGDFLVRNVIGADDSGAIAITDHVRVGQTVQFHVRDAATADEDLDTLLAKSRSRPAGALLFSCNGRGTRLFPTPDHDVDAIRRAFGPIPVAGFFAMGEIGPVGGQNFLHGFTASVALFEEEAR
jgi:small ligand-binding sensory domain FIST